jgi:uncharacterized protein
LISGETGAVESDGKILVNLTRAEIVCEHTEIADRPRRRMRGLLGRESLEPGAGMLLQPAPSIHTAFMRFPIDVAFMDGTLRVTKVVHELRPWRAAAARHAWAVIELAAGEIERRGVAIGDQLGLVRVTDKLGGIVAGPGGLTGLLEIPGDGRVTGESDNGFAATSHQDAPGSNGTSVLLIGADRRFRSVAAALLTRRGCVVTLGDHAQDTAALTRRQGPDVVVIDVGVSLTEAARFVAQIETLDRPVGLVLVGEEGEPVLSTLPVLPKWGSFDVLYEAIENARPQRTGRLANGYNL